MLADPATSTRRERARAATLDEIKATALGLMREAGATDIRFTDIARVMGMTPPALYRYYADRDALLTDLITDAYVELGEQVAVASQGVPPRDFGGRWLQTALAYRNWARSHPEQFALILGLPVAGYAPPEQGPTTEAAQAAMGQLTDLFVSAARAGRLRKPLVREVSPVLVVCEAQKHPEMEGIVSPETFQAMLQAWATLHGVVSLEAYGHFDWMEPAARDALFFSTVSMAAKASGLPVPSKLT